MYICKEEINLKIGKMYKLDLKMPFLIKKSKSIANFDSKKRILHIQVEKKPLKRKREDSKEDLSKKENQVLLPEMDIDEGFLTEIF